MRNILIGMAAVGLCVAAAERRVDPTFLRRHVPSVEPTNSDITTTTCRYRPLFGAGDEVTSVVRGVARFGEVTIDAQGSCAAVKYPSEEQIYVIMDGTGTVRNGDERAPVKRNDFLYLPPGMTHSVEAGRAPLRLFVMGFKVSGANDPTAKLRMANIDEVPRQTVSGHPDSVLYRLLMGDIHSKRDRIAAGRTLTSLYTMEFQSGGTNFPHHHDTEEEIYVLLDGSGDMVAGSGTNGIEARFPAKPGDAYFFRLNCTVGFYNGSAPSRILAVRSLYPSAR